MISFSCYGHKNITGKHKNTFEFTRDSELRVEGDCIIGLKSDFEITSLMEYIKDKKEIKIVIKVGEIKDEVNCEVNDCFFDEHEIVVRKGDYRSTRTLGINADKAAIDLDRTIMEIMKDPDAVMIVEIV